jgi:hypothetical protein
MKIGMIGAQHSGKTTIFNALTGMHADIASFSLGKIEPNIGIVEVLDERITKLSAIYQPKKTIYATIEYIDFVGLTAKTGQDAFAGEAMGMVKNTDALVLIVRNFHDEIIDETFGEANPIKEIDNIHAEMIISDLMIAEKRLERIELSKKRGIKDNSLLIEEKAVHTILEHLNQDKPIRTLELPVEEEKSVRGFQFISQKPLMIILNSDETNFGKNATLLETINSQHYGLEFAGKFEMELSRMEESEANYFMADLNLQESARLRLNKASYELLGLVSFFTVGKDEVRAWTIHKGENAVEAAGKIHSDLARGFIRAECFSYDAISKLGSEKALRDKGLFRLEGKNYLVQDGDILNIRFSV